LLEITNNKDWEGWICFFLQAVIDQAKINDQKAQSILVLYEKIKAEIPDVLKSRFTIQALETLFSSPIFNTNSFVNKTGIPPRSAGRLLNALKDHGILRTVREGRPKKPEVFVFEELFAILEL
jgi:DNA-binding transcriptional ArsR family regulator